MTRKAATQTTRNEISKFGADKAKVTSDKCRKSPSKTHSSSGTPSPVCIFCWKAL